MFFDIPGLFLLLVFNKNRVIALLKETKLFISREKRTNDCANPGDEEYCRRPSIFLPINRFKTNVQVQSSCVGVGT